MEDTDLPPSYQRIRKRRKRRTLLRWSVFLPVLLFLLVAVLYEGYAWAVFYANASSARESARSLKNELDLATLKNDEAQIIEIRGRLVTAQQKLAAAHTHVNHDPLLFLARAVPGLNKQANGLRELIKTAEAATDAGLAASEVLLDYTRHQDNPQANSLQEGIEFLQDEKALMADVRRHLDEATSRQSRVGSGLIGPLDRARSDLTDSIERLDELVTGYERAVALLPEILGFSGPKRLLILPQNETEIFPSGGLMSSYGVATFENGQITSMQFEYFVNLYSRWQQLSGGEYVEPPLPLKNYLLRDVSWALGEAGWFPDFPTSAQLANSFVEKGGQAPFDGTIAIDLHFVAELLRVLGPLRVGEAGVTVTAENISDVTLEQTRTESSLPGAQGKSFLGDLARALLDRLFASPKGQWVDLVRLLGKMGQERHLQLNFKEPRVQDLTREYGFDGALVQAPRDFLLLTDASVNSTKLNLILQTKAQVELFLLADGSVQTHVSYTVTNPFPEWQKGRDPRLVEALMLTGVYGSYLRAYAPHGATILDVRLDGQTVGPEQITDEFGKTAFGRFFPVAPGATRTVTFIYQTPGLIDFAVSGHYSLYIQKQAGTQAIPLTLRIHLPEGATWEALQLDGNHVGTSQPITTDLRTDRRLDVRFRP